MKQFYIEEWKWFKAKFLKIFIFVFIIFVLGALLSHVFFVNHPDQAQKKYVDSVKKDVEKFPMQVATFKFFWTIFLRNSRALLICILIGLIPFLFLPIFITFINSLGIGLLTSVVHLDVFQIEGFNKVVPVLLFFIAPHGIFELPAIFYATSLGIYLTFQVSKRILLYPSGEESLFPLFKRIFKTWEGVIIPLLLVAAIIESFVTLFLIKIFLEH